MPGTVKGRFFYWYMVKDTYSRKLVANEVHEAKSSQHASQLLHKACLREQTAGSPLVLHSDNGSVMKGGNADPGRGAVIQPASGQQRQRLRRGLVPHGQILSAVDRPPVRQRAAGQAMGAALCSLVQRRASPQRAEVCKARPASQKAVPAVAAATHAAVRAGQKAQPAAPERGAAQLASAG